MNDRYVGTLKYIIFYLRNNGLREQKNKKYNVLFTKLKF